MASPRAHTVALADYKGRSPTGLPVELGRGRCGDTGRIHRPHGRLRGLPHREGGEPFAGGRPFVLPFGTIYTPNITPDPETASASGPMRFPLNAVHRGIAPDGSRYYPAFPYASYTMLTDEDALAIKAYLFSLKPVKQQNKPNTFAFPFNQRWLMAIWSTLFNPNERFRPIPEQSDAWNRAPISSKPRAIAASAIPRAI